MSFCSDIKDKISNADELSPCCVHAFYYGLISFAHFSKFNLSITTEHRNLYDFYRNILKEYIGVDTKETDPNAKKLTAYVKSDKDKKKVFEKFGHDINETSQRINHANFENECCVASFLRGAFLACGNISDPNSGYHLEFVVPFKRLSGDLIKILSEIGLEAKYIVRKGCHIVYFKDSESIEDLLAYIGAQDASLYLMNVKIEKDIKNRVNRKLNFEMSNLDKILSASNAQIEAIHYIMSEGGLNLIPENLRELASLRLENPDASLSELGEMTGNTISRSGIKHRLDKIVEIAEKMKEKS